MVDKQQHPFLKIFPTVFVQVLKCCGVLPFSYSPQADWILTMYSIFLLLVCMLVKATTITVLNHSDKVNVGEVVDINRAFIISRFVKVIYPIIKALVPFVAILNALWKSKFLYQFCNYLCKSDELMDREELSLLMKTHMKIATRLVVFCLGVNLTAKLCSVLSLVYFKGLTDWHVLLWVALLYLVDTVGCVAEMQFVLMSIALQSRFLQVNNSLQNLFAKEDKRAEFRVENFAEEWGRSEKCNGQSGFTDTSTVKPVFLLNSKFRHLQETRMVLFESEFSSVQVLKVLRLRQRYLCAALRQLNTMFEYVLLISIFSLFLMILLNVYSAMFGLARALLLRNLSDTCFWLLTYLIRLVSPLVVTDSLVDQARRTVDILSTFATRYLSDASLKELQEFCREVESRKLAVTCAFNLFTVKTELLTAAVAAGTTYIVTLIQLH